MSCVTSSVCRLIIGGLLTLTVHLCNCIWKFSEAFTLWPFCEGFGQPHDFNIRAIFMTVYSMYCMCHLWVVGSCVWDVLSISSFLYFVGRNSIVGIATCYGPAQAGCGIYHPPLLSSAKVKESVELYFYSPCRPWMPVGGWNSFYFIIFLNCWSVWGQGSMVSIVTVPQGRWSWVQILVGTKDISLLENIQTSSGAHPAFYIRVHT